MELVDRLGRERDASFREKEESGFTKRLLAGLVVAALFVALARARGYARPRDARGAAGPFVLSAVYVAVLAVLGYGPTMSTMKQAGLFFFDAVAAGTFAVIVTVVVGYLLRWNLAEAAFLLLAPFIALLPIWAAVGADSTALSPPVASVIVFLLTPIVPIAASAAIGVAVLDVRRGAAQAPSPA